MCATLPGQEFGGSGVQNVERFVRIQRLGHGAYPSSLILVSLPGGLGHTPHQGVEEITRIEVALGQRLAFDSVDRRGDERVQPDLLRDEQFESLRARNRSRN